MGLDIYGHLHPKTRERKADESLNEYYNAISDADDEKTKQVAQKEIADGIAHIKTVEETGKVYPYIYEQFAKDMEKYFPYDHQRKELKDAKTSADIEAWAEKINWDQFYKPCDFYFRKVNCIYAYFADRLEDEIAEVTKDDVTDIISRATKVLAERDEETSMSTLPTQGGFFFGSTDYDEWYYQDMVDIIKQFSELLLKWKYGESCYILMSW